MEQCKKLFSRLNVIVMWGKSKSKNWIQLKSWDQSHSWYIKKLRTFAETDGGGVLNLVAFHGEYQKTTKNVDNEIYYDRRESERTKDVTSALKKYK